MDSFELENLQWGKIILTSTKGVLDNYLGLEKTVPILK